MIYWYNDVHILRCPKSWGYPHNWWKPPKSCLHSSGLLPSGGYRIFLDCGETKVVEENEACHPGTSRISKRWKVWKMKGVNHLGYLKLVTSLRPSIFNTIFWGLGKAGYLRKKRWILMGTSLEDSLIAMRPLEYRSEWGNEHPQQPALPSHRLGA